MRPRDAFEDLAPYYDAIMSHVDYDRWFTATTALASLIRGPLRHLDAACGTCVLLRQLRKVGWRSVGIDLSLSMLRTARSEGDRLPIANADLRALPMHRAFDYVTCLFDSINFLLTIEDVGAVFREFASALVDGGLLYFDVVTERMVTEHFAGQRWDEEDGGLATSWHGEYCTKTRIAETHVRVKNGPSSTIRERTYLPEEIEAALAGAGFRLIAAMDAQTWGPIRRRTVRIDYLATTGDLKFMTKRFESLRAGVRKLLR